MKKYIMPAGEWKIKQIADAYDVSEGLSDKPCFKITGPGQIEGFWWGWDTEQSALRKFVHNVYGITPYSVQTVKYFT